MRWRDDRKKRTGCKSLKTENNGKQKIPPSPKMDVSGCLDGLLDSGQLVIIEILWSLNIVDDERKRNNTTSIRYKIFWIALRKKEKTTRYTNCGQRYCVRRVYNYIIIKNGFEVKLKYSILERSSGPN